jgi:hypothetical protein
MQALQEIYGVDVIIGRESQKLDSEERQLDAEYVGLTHRS